MATSTKPPGEASAACPLCDDYSGPPSSVEAHISRKTDPIHQGEVGRAHRDDLQRQVADTGDVDSTDDRSGSLVEEVDQWDVEPDGEPAETSHSGEGEEGNAESPPSDGEAPSPDTDTPETDPEDGEGGAGIPVPIDPNIIMALAVLAVVAIVVYRLRSGDDEDDQDDEEEAEQAEPSGGGLIGA